VQRGDEILFHVDRSFCLGPLSDTDLQSIIGFRMSGLTERLEPVEVTEQQMIIADG
jgi:hypothetical protein